MYFGLKLVIFTKKLAIFGRKLGPILAENGVMSDFGGFSEIQLFSNENL